MCQNIRFNPLDHVHLFSKIKGIQLKLTKLNYFENKTSETIVKYCINTLNNLNISLIKTNSIQHKNTNTNFRKKNKHGTNNVYFKL